jgi:hypothetical protein
MKSAIKIRRKKKKPSRTSVAARKAATAHAMRTMERATSMSSRASEDAARRANNKKIAIQLRKKYLMGLGARRDK